MKTRPILSAPMLLALLCTSAVPARAQTPKPTVPSHQSSADLTARKQLAAYLTDFQGNPEDAALRDKIIDLAKTLKPAPVVPLAARTAFTRAAAQMKAASSADDFKDAARLFEQVAQQAPWYADAYFNAAAAYDKAAAYLAAKRNLALYMSAVRPGADTQKAEELESDIEQQLAAQQQQQAAQEFQQALQQFRANPNDSARAQMIKQAQAMRTPPVIPEEAREHYVMAQAFMEKATESTGFGSAINEYKAALLAAPWWADAYKRLAIAQKAAGQYDDAIASLNLYLAASPADARDAQDEIYKLRADKQAAAEQKAAEERRKWEEENSPQAIAARKQAEYDQWLQKLDGARFVGYTGDSDVRSEEELVIHGSTIVWRVRTVYVAPSVVWDRSSIGQWSDFGQVQITGHYAERHEAAVSEESGLVIEWVATGGYVSDRLTISDDGNRIDVDRFCGSVQGWCRHYTFSRQ